ncbi:MAG TPA: TolC family protein, partial [Gillisia sp.]|nr:TolC family protein [Gillisia sp.]
MNNFLRLLSFFLISLPFQAQELLTVEEAVKIALENNYQIRVAQNELEIDKAGVSIGNAGMLPTVGVAATNNNSIQNS